MNLTYCYGYIIIFLFFFKQKTAYEMRISDWSSDVCSSDLKIAKRAMACHFARRSGRFFQRQLDVQMGRRCNVDERIQGELGQLAAQQIIGPGPCQPKPLARFVL